MLGTHPIVRYLNQNRKQIFTVIIAKKNKTRTRKNKYILYRNNKCKRTCKNNKTISRIL